MATLGAVLIFTDRFEEMKSFYGDVLGLAVKDSDPGEGYRVGVDVIAYETGESMIEIFDANVHGAQLGDARRISARVVTALEVGDVRAWLAKNGDAVTPLTEVREKDWGTFVYVVDADGNPIQIYEEAKA
jgi:catechol 2,3-dioxygenase-like lactoylglutathione lyase family enzyme